MQEDLLILMSINRKSCLRIGFWEELNLKWNAGN